MAVRTPSVSASASATPALVPHGQHAGKPSMPMGRPFTLVGSRQRAHLHLLSTSISKCHAILVNDRGTLYVRDLASRDHVFVNGKPVRETDLKNGDLVKFGSFTFKFVDGAGRGRGVTTVRPPEAVLEMSGSSLPVPFDGRVMVIGRRPGCDIVLDEQSVSTIHAAIFELDGRHYIRDLGSRTGTLVNGQPIHHQPLEINDQIRIGDTEMRYVPGNVLGNLDELEHLVGTASLGTETDELASHDAATAALSAPAESDPDAIPLAEPEAAQEPVAADDDTIMLAGEPPARATPPRSAPAAATPDLTEIDLESDPDVSGSDDTTAIPLAPAESHVTPVLSSRVVDSAEGLDLDVAPPAPEAAADAAEPEADLGLDFLNEESEHPADPTGDTTSEAVAPEPSAEVDPELLPIAFDEPTAEDATEPPPVMTAHEAPAADPEAGNQAPAEPTDLEAFAVEETPRAQELSEPGLAPAPLNEDILQDATATEPAAEFLEPATDESSSPEAHFTAPVDVLGPGNSDATISAGPAPQPPAAETGADVSDDFDFLTGFAEPPAMEPSAPVGELPAPGDLDFEDVPHADNPAGQPGTFDEAASGLAFTDEAAPDHVAAEESTQPAAHVTPIAPPPIPAPPAIVADAAALSDKPAAPPEKSKSKGKGKKKETKKRGLSRLFGRRTQDEPEVSAEAAIPEVTSPESQAAVPEVDIPELEAAAPEPPHFQTPVSQSNEIAVTAADGALAEDWTEIVAPTDPTPESALDLDTHVELPADELAEGAATPADALSDTSFGLAVWDLSGSALGALVEQQPDRSPADVAAESIGSADGASAVNEIARPQATEEQAHEGPAENEVAMTPEAIPPEGVLDEERFGSGSRLGEPPEPTGDPMVDSAAAFLAHEDEAGAHAPAAEEFPLLHEEEAAAIEEPETPAVSAFDLPPAPRQQVAPPDADEPSEIIQQEADAIAEGGEAIDVAGEPAEHAATEPDEILLPLDDAALSLDAAPSPDARRAPPEADLLHDGPSVADVPSTPEPALVGEHPTAAEPVPEFDLAFTAPEEALPAASEPGEPAIEPPPAKSDPMRGMMRDFGSFLGGTPLSLPPVRPKPPTFGDVPVTRPSAPADEPSASSPGAPEGEAPALLPHEEAPDAGAGSATSFAAPGPQSATYSPPMDEPPELFDATPGALDALPDSLEPLSDLTEAVGEPASADAAGTAGPVAFSPSTPAPQSAPAGPGLAASPPSPLNEAIGLPATTGKGKRALTVTPPPRPKLRRSPAPKAGAPPEPPPAEPAAKSGIMPMGPIAMPPVFEMDVFSEMPVGFVAPTIPPVDDFQPQTVPATRRRSKARLEEATLTPQDLSETEPHDQLQFDQLPADPLPVDELPAAPRPSLPPRKKPRKFPFYFTMIAMTLTAAAAAGLWYGLPANSNVKASIRFEGLDKVSVVAQKEFCRQRIEQLRNETRVQAREIYEAADFHGRKGKGFLYPLGDDAPYQLILSQAYIDGDKLVLKREPTPDGEGDRLRFKALLRALYSQTRPIGDAAATQKRVLEQKRAELAGKTQEITKLNEQILGEQTAQAKYSQALDDEKDLADRSAFLEKIWRDATEKLRGLRADLEALQASDPATPIAASPDDDPQAREMAGRLKQLADAIATARGGQGGDPAKAGAALDAALGQLQQEITDARAAQKDDSPLATYLAQAQQIQESVRQSGTELAELQNTGRQTLATLQRSLVEKIDAHLKTAWAADPELVRLEQDLQVKQHRLGAATGAGLADDADKLRQEVAELNKAISVRRSQVAAADTSTDDIKNVQKVIADERDRMQRDQARPDQRMADQLKALAAAAPKPDGLSADQRAVLERLGQKIAAVSAARQQLAQGIATPPPGADAKKTEGLELQAAELQARMDARRKLFAVDAGPGGPAAAPADDARASQLSKKRVEVEIGEKAVATAFDDWLAVKKQLADLRSGLDKLKSAAATLMADKRTLFQLQNDMNARLKDIERQAATTAALIPQDPDRSDDSVQVTPAQDLRLSAIGALAILCAFVTGWRFAHSSGEDTVPYARQYNSVVRRFRRLPAPRATSEPLAV